MRNNDVVVLARCRVCRSKQRLGEEMEQHLYSHYNYCEYGHYEQFEIGDPDWPRCKNEEAHDES